MSISDIRWEQRFSNYNKAFLKSELAVIKIREEYQIKEDGTIDEDEFLDHQRRPDTTI